MSKSDPSHKHQIISDSHQNALLKDIKMARAEVGGRLDSIRADCEERLYHLDHLATQISDDTVSSKEAEAQIRRLVSSTGTRITSRSGSSATLSTTSRQTSVATHNIDLPGRSVGAKLQASGAASSVSSSPPRQGQVLLDLSKTVQQLDLEIMTRLTKRYPHPKHRKSTLKGGEAWQKTIPAGLMLELQMLGQMRAGLQSHLTTLPRDTVLLSTLVEENKRVQQVLLELHQKSASRLAVLVDSVRMRIAEMSAFCPGDAELKAWKERCREIKQHTKNALLEDYGTLLGKLQTLADRVSVRYDNESAKSSATSLFLDLLRRT